MSDYLPSIGFTMTPKGRAFPSGKIVPNHALKRLASMNGRLSNIEYMARAMDRLDNVADPAPGTSAGDRQFAHLVEHHPTAALLYFALRRLQRNGDVDGLRRGLTVLLAYDHDEMDSEDAIAMLWPEGSHPPAAIPALAAPSLKLAAA